MSKAVWRALSVAADREARYAYDKTSVTEELDARGQAKDRKEKLYEVVQVGGVPHQRLVRINSQPLPFRKLQEQDRKEQEARREFEGEKKTAKPNDRSTVLTAELVGRFTFAVEQREMIHGRPTLRLSFTPQDGQLPVKRLADRVINKLAGTVWMDEQESEVVRADLRLTGQVSLWGGFLGALDTFTLSLERSRTADGVWFNQALAVVVEGRKFLKSMRYRVREESKGFRKLGVTPAAAAAAGAGGGP